MTGKLGGTLRLVYLFSLLFPLISSQAETNTASADWETFRQTVLQSGIQELDHEFVIVSKSAPLSAIQLGMIRKTELAIQNALTTNSSDPEARRSTLRNFLELNNTLELLRLQVSTKGLEDMSDRQFSQTISKSFDLLTYLNQEPNSYSKEKEAHADAMAKSISDFYGETKKTYSIFLRKQSIRTLQLKVRSLGQYPNHQNTQEAIAKLDAAGPRVTSDFEAAGDLENQALKALYPSLTSWDTRHLLHLLQLDLMVSHLISLDAVSETQKNDLRTELSDLQKSQNEEDYRNIAEKLTKEIETIGQQEGDASMAAAVTPERVEPVLLAQIKDFRPALTEMRKRVFENRNMWQRYFGDSTTNQLFSNLSSINVAFQVLEETIRTTSDPKVIQNTFQALPHIRLLYQYTLSATNERLDVAQKYSALLASGLNSLGSGQQFLTPGKWQDLRQIVISEGKEQLFNVYVNQETITVGAMSALLVAEAATILVSGGSTAAAMPATVHAIQMAATVTSLTARAVLIAGSTEHLVDRVHDTGWSGAFSNMDTYFDLLVITALIPRGMPQGMKMPGVTPWYGKTAQALENGWFKTWAPFSYSAGLALGGLGVGGGTYYIVEADRIAHEMEMIHGYKVTPAEVRRKGLVYMATGIMSLALNFNYWKAGEKLPPGQSETFTKTVKPATIGGEISRFLERFKLISYGKSISASWGGGIFGNALGVGAAAFQAGYEYILINEGLLIRTGNLDTLFYDEIQAAEPYPDLNDGESALLLVGIDPADYPLYAGAHAKHSSRTEIIKYGKRYIADDFTSPDDLLAKLQLYSSPQYGKIRYLKIVTHGHPGLLYTRMIPDTDDDKLKHDPEGGWINSEWIRAHRARIMNITRNVFAPDARIVVFACLAGSDKWIANEGSTDRLIGSHLAEDLADAFLPNGGSMDLSNRMLLGVDTAYGSFLDQLVSDSLVDGRDPSHTAILEPADFISPSVLMSLPKYDPNSPMLIDIDRTLGRRVAKIMLEMPIYTYRFGFNLYGPDWWRAYKHVHVNAHD